MAWCNGRAFAALKSLINPDHGIPGPQAHAERHPAICRDLNEPDRIDGAVVRCA
jgi:hypothetical protein